jgi:hypothetical protein
LEPELATWAEQTAANLYVSVLDFVETGDFLQYKATTMCVALQFAVIAWRFYFRSPASRRPKRSASDLTWFVPVFVWGIESLRHAHWFAFDAPVRGIAPSGYLFLPRAELTGFILGAVLLACFLAEYLAHRVGCAGRQPQATLPLPVAAAVFGVQSTWCLLLLAFTYHP